MRVAVCEVEPALRKHLTGLAQSLGYEVVAQTEHLDDIKSVIISHQPEVILLNAHTPNIEQHCQALQKEFNYPPAFIFSGLDDVHLTLSAFKAGASDYLLIPVQPSDLDRAIKKCCKLNAAQQSTLQNKDGKTARPRQYIAARTHRGVELIALADVYYFSADQKYVKVRHKNGVVLIDETLKDLEQEFEGHMFRIHRNALVNLDYLDLLETVDSGQYQVRFRDMNETLAVSRRHLPTLREKIYSI